MPKRGGVRDPAAAHANLARVTLTPCRPLGLFQTYVHARVTFRNSGEVSKLVIDAPPGLTTEAVACIARQVDATYVEEFAGEEATVSQMWFVP
jgi:hypothetical protein